MNRLLYLLLASCALFGRVLNIMENERDQIFAEDGESRLKPARTLQILRKLSIAYGLDDCSGCEKMKREVDRLIAISEATEDKCNQHSVDYINKLIRAYSKSKLNLIPFLHYYKKQLIELCEDQFDVTSLRWESVNSNYWDDSTNHASDVDTDEGVDRNKDTDRNADQQKVVAEDSEGYSKSKRENEEKYSRNLESHREANEIWMKRHNELLYDMSCKKEPKQLLDALIRLDRDRLSTFGLNDSIKIQRTLGNLIGLRYYSVFSCNKKQFDTFSSLIKEFSQGYNPSIMKYIYYYRDKFWQKCKLSLLEGQNRRPFFQNDQAEVFSLVDKVFATDTLNMIGEQSIKLREGLQSYVESKIAKRPYNEEELVSLFEDTIEPACESVELRFKNLRELSEVVDENQDLKNDLDENSLKWLKALKVCCLINDNPELLNQARSHLS